MYIGKAANYIQLILDKSLVFRVSIADAAPIKFHLIVMSI